MKNTQMWLLAVIFSMFLFQPFVVAQDFTSNEDGFSVWFPAKPEFSTGGTAGTGKIRRFMLATATGVFAVSVNKVASPADSENTREEAFDGARDALLGSLKAEVLSEKSIQRGTATGRDTVITSKTMNCRHLMFLEDVVFYQVMFCGDGSNYRLQTANKFFDSFKIISEEIPDETEETTQPSSQLLSLLKEGRELFDAKNYSGAAVKFGEVIKLEPNYESAYFYRGLSRHELKQYNLAIADFTKAIGLSETTPILVENYYNRGLSYTRAGKSNEAIADFTKAISLNSEYWQAYFSRGANYFNAGNTNAALKDYSKVIELNPSLAITYTYRADCYDKLGRKELARKDRETAASLKQ